MSRASLRSPTTIARNQGPWVVTLVLFPRAAGGRCDGQADCGTQDRTLRAAAVRP
jgi:hypothetical protein